MGASNWITRMTAALIDRLVHHHAEVLPLAGTSYRTRARCELLAKDRPPATNESALPKAIRTG
ncbi:hypothetical protein EJ571_24830 [Mycobacteroides franklinii]|uniref:Uncharacterized protein n=1 Tax=Mycobacteroides franklinii TaxID=948102 RepID=A0A4R5P4K5_9MYCO|nr:hypothetical protein EJ571_24830 [Mycobacteroides franklinii]